MERTYIFVNSTDSRESMQKFRKKLNQKLLTVAERQVQAEMRKAECQNGNCGVDGIFTNSSQKNCELAV